MLIGEIMKKFKALVAAAALVASVLVPGVAQAAPLVVPKASWPVCSETKITYCIESATIQSIGSVAEPLVWVASGSAEAGATAAAVAPTVTTVAGKALAGHWTTPTWATDGHADLGYDGIFINVQPANPFVNHLMADVVPTKGGATINQANQTDNANFATSLNLDEIISFKVRTGDIIPGVTIGVGSTMTVAVGVGFLTFTGTPVIVAEASSARACGNEDGVAVANMNQLAAFVIVENDDNGFGVEGLTGRMNVTSNGTCEMSTPVWNEATGELTWKASSPHFAKDGVTPNLGIYRAVIPAADAAILFGLTDPKKAASALTVSVANDGTNKVAAIKKVSYLRGNIIIEHSGFQYSVNTFKIKKNPKYKNFSALKMRTCKQTKPALPGANVIKQKAGACPVGYKG
jgi:hypothetical protein